MGLFIYFFFGVRSFKKGGSHTIHYKTGEDVRESIGRMGRAASRMGVPLYDRTLRVSALTQKTVEPRNG